MKKRLIITSVALTAIALLAVYCTEFDYDIEKKPDGGEIVTPTVDKYEVTVIGGAFSAGTAGAGLTSYEFEAGVTVSVTAGQPLANQQFHSWSANPAVTFAGNDNTGETTSFTMPSNAVTVTANFENTTPLSSEKKIIEFVLFASSRPIASGAINHEEGTITAEDVPSETDVTALTPTIIVSPNATVSPESGVAQDFSSPVTYTVTAEDGSPAYYTVTVTKAQGGVLSSAKQILAFEFSLPLASVQIDQSDKKISVTMPPGTDVKSLTPTTITVSANATVSPEPGAAQDFSSPVIYTVTAEDGTTADYEVTVTVTLAKYTLTTSADPAAGGAVTRDPNLIQYDERTQVIVTANANEGYKFVRWEGASTETSQSVTVTMNSDVELTAHFEDTTTTTYDVTVKNGPSDDGTVIGKYAEGNTVDITATVPEGNEFVKWTTASSGVAFADEESQSTSFTMPANEVVVMAEFRVKTFTLDVSRNEVIGGNVSVSVNGSASSNPGSSSHDFGTVISVTATATSGYKFTRWEPEEGTSLPTFTSGDANTSFVSFSIIANVSIKAIFERFHTVVVSRSYDDGNVASGGNVFVTVGNGNPSVNPADTAEVYVGTRVTIEACPTDNSYFLKWTKESGDFPAMGFDEFNMLNTFNVNADVDIKAEFKRKKYTIHTIGDYETIKVGNTYWMRKNLDYHDPNWGGSHESRCYNSNSQFDYCAVYGRLYTWEEAKSACTKLPEDYDLGSWRLPDTDDWETLVNSVGDKSTAGRILKSEVRWNDDGNGIDSIGFTALPGGRSSDGNFQNQGVQGYWWTATENTIHTEDVWYWYMEKGKDEMDRNWSLKTNRLSVRCVIGSD